MSDRILEVGLVQHACGDDPERNLRAGIDGIREAVSRGADLVLLPELHRNPYFCKEQDPAWFDLAEPVPGPTTGALGEVAAGLGVVVVGSLFERRAPGLYHNTAVVLERDGSLAGIYRKSHIPQDPGYEEKFYFAPGDTGFRPVTTSLGRLGILVCWDQWFPEAARLLALAGADLLLAPTAIGWDPDDDEAERQRQLEAWVTVQRGHAVANLLPLLACNRTGEEPDPRGGPAIPFWGNSFVCDPQGELLARAPAGEEQVLTARLDLSRSERLRRIWPFFRDRRTDLYDDLSNRYLDPPEQ